MLDGWKTKIAAVLMILGALYFAGIEHDYEKAYALATAGMTTLGIGGKLEKVREALEGAK